ncbi:hypothetical protein DFH06DRAFT_1332774 [Mycena polygramma]|nr:hypothetical protein DFH06DRAFT_1332774 [Mycena polygramma]
MTILKLYSRVSLKSLPTPLTRRGIAFCCGPFVTWWVLHHRHGGHTCTATQEDMAALHSQQHTPISTTHTCTQQCLFSLPFPLRTLRLDLYLSTTQQLDLDIGMDFQRVLAAIEAFSDEKTGAEELTVQFRRMDGQKTAIANLISEVPHAPETRLNLDDLTHLYLGSYVILVAEAHGILRSCINLEVCVLPAIEDNAETDAITRGSITLPKVSRFAVGLIPIKGARTFFRPLHLPALSFFLLDGADGEFDEMELSEMNPNEFLYDSKATLSKLHLRWLYNLTTKDLGELLAQQQQSLETIRIESCTGDWGLLDRFPAKDFPMLAAPLAQFEVTCTMPPDKLPSLKGFVDKLVDAQRSLAPERRTLRKVALVVYLDFPDSVPVADAEAEMEQKEEELRHRWGAVIADSEVSLGVCKVPRLMQVGYH